AYTNVGITSYDKNAQTFMVEYTPAQFSAEAAMNDMARYLGALYRQSCSTIISLTYLEKEYVWDNTGSLKGSNWMDGTTSLVSTIVANITSYNPAKGIEITVSDGVNEETLTLKFEVTSPI
ncbi:MAG: hypothetical protein ACERLG_11385, partial [Sedimentibacter sp.]